MIKYLVIFIFIFIFSEVTLAQDCSSFFVVNVKGNVEKQSSGSWKKIQNNEFLSKDDIIRIKENSFINIFDKNNKKYFVVHGIRTLSIKDLINSPKNIAETPLNNVLVKTLQNFANVFNKFTENRDIKNLFRSSNYTSEVVLISPKNSKVFGDSIAFYWISRNNVRNVRFVLLNEELSIIIDTTINNNNYFILKNTLEPKKEYIWQISLPDDKKNVLGIFSIPDTLEILSLNKQLDSIENIINIDNKYDLLILKALVCEELSFHSKAYSLYQQVMIDSNDKDKYKHFLDSYFMRRKINLLFDDVLTNK